MNKFDIIDIKLDPQTAFSMSASIEKTNDCYVPVVIVGGVTLRFHAFFNKEQAIDFLDLGFGIPVAE